MNKRAETMESAQSMQMAHFNPFQIEDDYQYEGACKTQTSMEEYSGARQSLGDPIQNSSLNFRSSHVPKPTKGQMRPEIPSKSLKKKIDELVKGNETMDIQETPRDIYIPGELPQPTIGLDDALPVDFSIKRREPKQIVQMKGTVGLFGTCFTMLKVFLGIGILATPKTFEDVGILGGIFGLIMIGIMNTYTMHLQIQAKVKLNKVIVSYSDLSKEGLGIKWKTIVDAFMVISQLGFCIAYLLFVGSQFETIICHEQGFCNHKSLYLFIAMLCLIPVCWLKSMNILAYFSIFSNTCLFFSLFVIVYYCITNRTQNPQIADEIKYFQISGVPMFFGIAVFDFEGNNIVLNVHQAMKEPKKVGRVLIGVLIVYVTMLASFSSVAYFCYGSAIKDMVTLNLPHDRLTATLQIFYSLGLLGSYPIQMMPFFEIIEKSTKYAKAKACGKYKVYVFRTFSVIGTALVAMSVPRFGLFINLVGSVACTALAFVIPVLIYNNAFQFEISRRRIWAHRALMAGGCVCGALSFYVSVYNIVVAVNDFDLHQVNQS